MLPTERLDRLGAGRHFDRLRVSGGGGYQCKSGWRAAVASSRLPRELFEAFSVGARALYQDRVQVTDIRGCGPLYV